MTASTAAARPRVDQIWYTRCPVPTASGIAIDRGLLEAEFGPAITVSSLRAAPDRDVRESHYDHRQPALFREGGNVPALWARARGEDTRLIGLTWVEERQAILARPDADLREAADLRGKRLLLPGHGGSRVDFWQAMALRGFLSALSAGGLEPDDVTFTEAATIATDLTEGVRPTRYAEELAALREGRADAIYVKGAPGADLTERHGLTVVVDLAERPERSLRINNGTPRTLTVSGDLLDRRPDLVARYLAQLLKAAAWALGHPADVARTVAAETGGTAAGVTAAYGDGLHRALRPRLTAGLLGELTDQKDFLLAHRFLPADVDIAAWADDRPLTEAQNLLDNEENPS
jgi:ABC-type nitrate/sulfonate/bicarbonate transport system substrate-binding protein